MCRCDMAPLSQDDIREGVTMGFAAGLSSQLWNDQLSPTRTLRCACQTVVLPALLPPVTDHTQVTQPRFQVGLLLTSTAASRSPPSPPSSARTAPLVSVAFTRPQNCECVPCYPLGFADVSLDHCIHPDSVPANAPVTCSTSPAALLASPNWADPGTVGDRLFCDWLAFIKKACADLLLFFTSSSFF